MVTVRRRGYWRSLVGSGLRGLKGNTRGTKIIPENLRAEVPRITKDSRSPNIGQLRSFAFELDGIAPLSSLRYLVSWVPQGIPPLKSRSGDGVTDVEVSLIQIERTRRPTLGIIALLPDLLISNTARSTFRAYLSLGVVDCLLRLFAALGRRREHLWEEAAVTSLLGSYDIRALLQLSMLMLAVDIED
jgi:hypothetical protein